MIDSFQGSFRFLSNFYPAPVTLDGVEYPTVEHAYQAAKCTDVAERLFIEVAPSPGEAKRRGRLVTSYRPDWDTIKLSIMEDLLRQKFQHPSLRRMLLVRTRDEELIEGNNWGDTYWGVCRGEGENHLGRLLMKIRAEVSGNKAQEQ